MLRNFVQLSIRSIHSAKFLRVESLTSTTKCRYSKWISRRPAAIVNEDELFDDDGNDDAQKNIAKSLKKRASEARAKKLKEKKKENPEEKGEEQVITKEPIYQALKEDDKLIR